MFDLIIFDAGSICLVTPKTAAGKDWIGINMKLEAQHWLGGSVTIEPPNIVMMIDSALEVGLEVGAV